MIFFNNIYPDVTLENGTVIGYMQAGRPLHSSSVDIAQAHFPNHTVFDLSPAHYLVVQM